MPKLKNLSDLQFEKDFIASVTENACKLDTAVFLANSGEAFDEKAFLGNVGDFSDSVLNSLFSDKKAK